MSCPPFSFLPLCLRDVSVFFARGRGPICPCLPCAVVLRNAAAVKLCRIRHQGNEDVCELTLGAAGAAHRITQHQYLKQIYEAQAGTSKLRIAAGRTSHLALFQLYGGSILVGLHQMAVVVRFNRCNADLFLLLRDSHRSYTVRSVRRNRNENTRKSFHVKVKMCSLVGFFPC